MTQRPWHGGLTNLCFLLFADLLLLQGDAGTSFGRIDKTYHSWHSIRIDNELSSNSSRCLFAYPLRPAVCETSYCRSAEALRRKTSMVTALYRKRSGEVLKISMINQRATAGSLR